MKPLLLSACLAVVLSSAAHAVDDLKSNPSDWPQWRGPTRDGVAPSQTWSWKWPEDGPTKLWSVNIGSGYASPIVSKGRVFGFGRTSGDWMHCIDAVTGNLLWKTQVGKGQDEFVSSTPCTDGAMVFCVTADGIVTALDTQDGKEVWKVNIVKEYKASRGGFHGIANSPLLAGDVLVLAQGLGLEKNTGKLLWQNREVMTEVHCSPILCIAQGQLGVLIAAPKGLVRIDPANGKVLWQTDPAVNLGLTYMDPIVNDEQILAINGSAGNKFQFNNTSVTPNNKDILNTHIYGYFGAGDLANPVKWRDQLYCFGMSASDRSGMFADNPELVTCNLECFDANTLTKRWTKKGISGTPIVCDGKLIVQGQWGDLRVLEASPEGFKELANAKVFDWKQAGRGILGQASFSTPVLVNGRIYCREFHGELICLDVSKDYPNPDQKVGQHRFVGEVQTITGALSAKEPGMPEHVVGILTEDPQDADPQGKPRRYKICALKHSNNPGHLEKIAASVAKQAHVSVTGTLFYDNQLSANVVEEISLTAGATGK